MVIMALLYQCASSNSATLLLYLFQTSLSPVRLRASQLVAL